MKSFWDWILGDDASQAGTPEWQWANLPESWVVFVWIAVVGLIATFVFWLYSRENATCPRPVRLILAAIRFSVLLLLVVLFFRPSVVYRQVNVTKGNVALLRDNSLSFSMRDRYADPGTAERLAKVTGMTPEQIRTGTSTRAELLYGALNNNQQERIRQLRDKGTVRVVDFGETSSVTARIPAIESAESSDPEESAAQTDSVDLPAQSATGRGTSYWQVLHDVLEDSGRLSAIILASDGQDNGSGDPLELARRARDLGIPVFVVGVGDPTRPRNLQITDLYVRDRVPVQEPFEIEALLYAEDIEQGSVTVELLQHDCDAATGTLSEGRPVDSVNVDVPEGGGKLKAGFQQKVAAAGHYAWTVRVQNVEGEIDGEDNARTSNPMQVVDQKVKVLLIAGAPTWEYQMLQRLYQRDQNIILSCWLQTMDEERPQEGNEPITRLPENLEELGQYNVVMMIDPNPEEFDENWVEMLRQFCRVKAGGVFYMAGPKHTAMFVTLNRLSGIRDILPVRFGDSEFIDTTQAIASTTSTRPGNMLTVGHNLSHPVMSFVPDEEENSRLWKLMPGIFWSFPALAAKPATLVLMERGDLVNVEGNSPLLVAGRYGAGNVLYMGFHGTWRWRKVGAQAQYFDRFWIQVVNYLVETRSLQGKRRGTMNTDRREYELGNEIMLTAQVLNERFEELDVPEIDAVITDDEGRAQKVTLRQLPGQPGNFEARVVAHRTGNFQVVVNLPGSDSETGIESISYRVRPPGTEMRAAWLNEKILREIADASGGEYLPLADIDRLASLVPRLDSTSEYTSPPRPIWDLNNRTRLGMFLIPFLLLTLEWALRKKFRML